MINKKKTAAIVAVGIYFQEKEELKQSKKVSWTDHRVGWTSQPRNNWTKLK
jgi:hypothetical protein